LAFVITANLAVDRALSLALDPKQHAERLEWVISFPIVSLPRGNTRNGKERTAHRMLLVGKCLFLVTFRTSLVANVGDVRMNI
jgi:hypothetical protein